MPNIHCTTAQSTFFILLFIIVIQENVSGNFPMSKKQLENTSCITACT